MAKSLIYSGSYRVGSFGWVGVAYAKTCMRVQRVLNCIAISQVHDQTVPPFTEPLRKKHYLWLRAAKPMISSCTWYVTSISNEIIPLSQNGNMDILSDNCSENNFFGENTKWLHTMKRVTKKVPLFPKWAKTDSISSDLLRSQPHSPFSENSWSWAHI